MKNRENAIEELEMWSKKLDEGERNMELSQSTCLQQFQIKVMSHIMMQLADILDLMEDALRHTKAGEEVRT